MEISYILLIILLFLLLIYGWYWYDKNIKQKPCPFKENIKCSVKLHCKRCHYYKEYQDGQSN